jgi:hypothetical protein
MVPAGLHVHDEPISPVPARPTEEPTWDEGRADRRSSCRYAVSDTVCVLCWWEPIVVHSATAPEPPARSAQTSIHAAVMARGPAFRNVAATRQAAEAAREAAEPKPQETMQQRYVQGELVDISQTGMAVLCAEVPRTDRKIWLRLDQPETTGWVEVVLKGYTQPAPEMHLIRLAFVQACPYDFFKAAIYAKSKPELA